MMDSIIVTIIPMAVNVTSIFNEQYKLQTLYNNLSNHAMFRLLLKHINCKLKVVLFF